MPTFRYDNDETRVYPDLGGEVAAGDVVEAESNPDGHRFVEVLAETVAERKAREKAEAVAAAEQHAGEGE